MNKGFLHTNTYTYKIVQTLIYAYVFMFVFVCVPFFDNTIGPWVNKLITNIIAKDFPRHVGSRYIIEHVQI